MIQNNNKINAEEQLDLARSKIKELLIPIGDLTDGQAKRIIGKYRVAVEPNFIPWMQRAYATAKSSVAKGVILENLKDEVSQDHPRMLRDFANGSGVNIGQEHYERVSESVLDMWKLIGNDDGLTNVTIAATLENTSLEFIPYLADLGKSLRCKDFTYTDVHGKADIKHAQELYRGLVEEMQYENEPLRILKTAMDKTTVFLGSLLRAN